MWRRTRPPEPAIARDEVMDIIGALADLKAWTLRILEILGDDEEEDEP